MGGGKKAPFVAVLVKITDKSEKLRNDPASLVGNFAVIIALSKAVRSLTVSFNCLSPFILKSILKIFLLLAIFSIIDKRWLTRELLFYYLFMTVIGIPS